MVRDALQPPAEGSVYGGGRLCFDPISRQPRGRGMLKGLVFL